MVALYSDLLLHDVSPSGAPLVSEPGAGRMFRTAPLWGVSQTPPYMHDGRAQTLRDAVLAHDGEATKARDAFKAADAAQQAAVIAFLNSL